MVRSPTATVIVALTFLSFAGQAASQTPTPKPAPTKKAPAAPAKKSAPAPTQPVAPPAPVVPPPAPEPPASDIKVVTDYTQGAQVSTNTTLIRGERQRVEFPGMISLDQCDLQRTVLLSPASKRYRIQSYGPTSTAPASSASPITPHAGTPQAGGVVTLTTTLTDTSERQQMFGLEARHIKTTMTQQGSPNACDKSTVKTEIDAWYVDLPRTARVCARPTAPASSPAAPDACQDRIESKVVGDAKLGFPVKTVTTVVTGEGEKQETLRTVPK